MVYAEPIHRAQTLYGGARWGLRLACDKHYWESSKQCIQHTFLAGMLTQEDEEGSDADSLIITHEDSLPQQSQVRTRYT